MKTLIILLLLTTASFAQNRFGWIGDSGQKPVRSLHSSQWQITTPIPYTNLTKGLPEVYNQGSIGSCVANGTLSAWSYALNKQTGKHLDLSRLQVYYDARVSIGTARVDSGSQIVDCVNNMMKKGGAKENVWPYITNRFTTRPPASVYIDAKKQIVVQAYKVDNTDEKSIRIALTNGYPVVVGSLVYSGINRVTYNSPCLEMPRKGEKYIGGHCYLITGHCDGCKTYRARNSWGVGWGKNGDFFVPYAYIHNGKITEDCWVITLVEAK